MVQKKTIIWILTFQLISLNPIFEYHLPISQEMSLTLKIGTVIYLLFLNGWLIFTILFPRYQEFTQKFIYSIILSILFDMIIGFFVAAGFYALGMTAPFNEYTLSWAFSGFSTILVITYAKIMIRDNLAPTTYISPLKKLIPNIQDAPLLLLFGLVMITSIIGSFLFKYTHSGRYIAIAWLGALIPVFWIIVRQDNSLSIYKWSIFNISIILTAPIILGTSVLLGTDGHPEVYISKLVLVNHYWSPSVHFKPEGTFTAIYLYQLYNTLPDSILMPLFSIFMHTNVVFIAKEVIPSLFAMVFPLALYEVYTKIYDKKKSFVSVLLVIFFEFYYYNIMLGGARQPIVELFLVVLLLALVDHHIETSHKRRLLLLLTLGLVISHYGTSAYYMVVFIISIIVFTILFYHSKIYRSEIKHLRTVTLFLVVLFISWNALVYPFPTGTFKVIALLGWATIKALLSGTRFSGGAPAVVPAQLIAPKIELGVYMILFLLAGVGIIGVINKIKEPNQDSLWFFSISIGAFITYGILYPLGTANAMSSWRSAHLSMVSFAPLIVTGIFCISQIISKTLRIHSIQMMKIIASGLLGLMLLFGSTIGYSIFDEHPNSIRAIFFYQKEATTDPALALALYSVYPQSTDITSALWVGDYRALDVSVYGCECYKRGVLWSYSMIPFDYKTLNLHRPIPKGYIFLGYINCRFKLTCEGQPIENTLEKSLNKEINIIYNNLNSTLLLNSDNGGEET